MLLLVYWYLVDGYFFGSILLLFVETRKEKKGDVFIDIYMWSFNRKCCAVRLRSVSAAFVALVSS